MNRVNNPDVWSSIFFLIVGVTVCVGSIEVGLGTMSKPGPGFMAFLAGIVLAAVSFAVILRAVIAGDEGPWKVKIGAIEVAYVLASMSAFGILLEKMGFLLATFLFLTLLLKLTGRMRWMSALLAGGVPAVLLYLLFVYLLEVQLPKGVIIPL